VGRLEEEVGMAVWSLALTRRFAVCAILTLLLPLVSHAQQFPETERQKAAALREKAQDARKKADREATEEAYKAMTAQTPRIGKKVDPWGGLRAAPGQVRSDTRQRDRGHSIAMINGSDEETDQPLVAVHRARASSANDGQHLTVLRVRLAPGHPWRLIGTARDTESRSSLTRNLELPIAIVVDETCVTNSEQLTHFLDGLGNHAARLAGL
jgi:hypothetical protein